MAGFSRIYCIGGEGGFQGADGINPLLGQILVGDASRQWLEPLYAKYDLGPLGHLKTIVPAGPDHPDMILDACIAFFPGLALMLAVFCFNLLGDGLRDIIDPQRRT